MTDDGVYHKVVVDLREPDIMVELLRQAGFHVVTAEDRQKFKLEVGDYIIDDKIVFSLKSFPDFFNSVKTDHLHNEIYDMLALPGNLFIALLVWGRDEAEPIVQYQVDNIVPTINAFYLPVFVVNSRDDACALMWRWAEKCSDKAKKYAQFPLQCRRRVEVAGVLDKKISDCVRLYMNLPGIDETLAVQMERVYPTMDILVHEIKRTKDFVKERYKTKKFWQESVVWYHKLPGIGPGKAAAIEKALLEPDKELQTNLTQFAGEQHV